MTLAEFTTILMKNGFEPEKTLARRRREVAGRGVDILDTRRTDMETRMDLRIDAGLRQIQMPLAQLLTRKATNGAAGPTTTVVTRSRTTGITTPALMRLTEMEGATTIGSGATSTPSDTIPAGAVLLATSRSSAEPRMRATATKMAEAPDADTRLE